MVKPLYLCSLKERVGKSMLSIGILKKLERECKKVTYFKPIGISKSAFTAKADPDVGFIQSCVETSSLPYDLHSPVSVPDCYYIDTVDAEKKREHLANIKKSYDQLTADADYVVIEGGPSIKKFIRVGLDDVTVAQTLGINDLIFVETESSDKCIDNLFFAKKYFEFRNINIKGIIFNQIDFDYKARIQELDKNHIGRYNIPIFGIIEKSIELISPRVSEVQAAIGGELINDPAVAGLNNRVESYIVGAMNTQSALKYLRQTKKTAIITGGDRTDLALAALGEDVSALILTGFIQPDVKVIYEANQRTVPIILSPSDTYTTLRNINRLKPGLQEDEISIVTDFIDKFIDWEKLLE